LCLFTYCGPPRHLPPFPTRRSSDLLLRPSGLLAHRRALWTLHPAGDHGAAGMAAGAGARAMKVLVLTGPESSGKSWLAARLHRAFGGLLVDEYVRDFIDSEQRDTCLADIPAI